MTNNNNDKFISKLKETFEVKSTDELLEIWNNNDRDVYSKDAFVAIRQILNNRDVDIPAQQQMEPKCVIESKWDLHEICKIRRLYLIFFLTSFVSYIIAAIISFYKSEKIESVNTFLVGVAVVFSLLFLFALLLTVRKVRQYKTGTLCFMAIGSMLPVLSPFILLSADLDIYSAIVEKKISMGTIKRALSPLSIYSLLFAFFPFVGLPLAFFSFREIQRSNGNFYGLVLANISTLINIFLLSLYVMKWSGVTIFFIKNN